MSLIFRFQNRAVQTLITVAAFATLGACGGSSGTIDQPPELEPPAPGQGVQFKMVSTLSAGQEIERCQFVQAPVEGLNINHQEVRYTPGSHHVLLYATGYLTIPTKDLHGQTRDTSGVMDCPLGATNDWQVTGVLGGAQSTHGGSLVALPSDTAVKVPGNAVLLINTHYLNASTKDLKAEARINLYTIPDEQVKQEGGVLFFYNPFIRVPAASKASARLRCRMSKSITIANVQSHMHRRGMGYTAQLLDANANPVETLYTNTEWEEVPVKEFAPGKVVPAGSYLDYQCDYNNTENRTILQGPSTKDEMCMLLGSYYPRSDADAYCMDSVFVGGGAKSCAESLKCSLDAIKVQNNDGFYGCVVDSCPAVANPFTDALKCFFNRAGSACQASCDDPASAGCVDCVQKSCQPKTDACAAAKCG